jgi:hypothetical protein
LNYNLINQMQKSDSTGAKKGGGKKNKVTVVCEAKLTTE